jgi:hypothetical protein
MPAPPKRSYPAPEIVLKLPNTSSYEHLVTPDLIARALYVYCGAPLLKYAEVVDSQYAIKLGPGVSDYEYRVLQFLETIPSVPTPRPIDYFDVEVTVTDCRTYANTCEVWHVLVMSTIPGEMLAELWDKLKPEQLVAILKETMGCIDQIDSVIRDGASFPGPDGKWSPLQRPVDTIGDLDGEQGRCIELPYYRNVFPGCVHLDDFVARMTRTALQPPATQNLLEKTLQSLGPTTSSDIRFCHMDLNSCNIMVDKGRLSGIIDWELAGWYTWRLEVLGGMKGLREGAYTAPYVEAWEVPKDLVRLITRTLSTLQRGNHLYRQEQQKLAREKNGQFKDPRKRKAQKAIAVKSQPDPAL